MAMTLELETETSTAKQNKGALILDKARLIELWEIGVLPASGFIPLAIEYDREVNGKEQIDLDNFIREWRTVTADGKEKELKKAQVVSVLAALEKKKLIKTDIRQIELKFDY